MSKAMTRLLRHDQPVPRGNDGAIHCSDIIGECRKKKKFDDASQWLVEDWMSTQAKGGETKKRFQYCVNPNSSNQFLYFRAIQGLSGDNAVDPALQDNVLLPKGFTEYIYHVGNANELNSAGGMSLKRGRQAVFFTTVNPMEDVYGVEDSMRSDETKDRAIQEYLETPSNTVCWCNLKLAQEKDLQFFFTKRGHVQSFSKTHNRQLAWRSGMYENEGGALPEGSLDSESATSCVKIQLAAWSARSSKSRRKITLGTIERFEKLVRHL